MVLRSRCLFALVVAFSIAGPVLADQDERPDRDWRTTAPSGVSQRGSISRTRDGLSVYVGISGRGAGSTGAPAAAPPRQSQQLTYGGRPAGGAGAGGRTAGGLSQGGSSPRVEWGPSTGGANQIVRGGPSSFETQPGGRTTPLGGASIGGWSFPAPAPGDPTAPGGPPTAWTPVGPVPRIDAWAVARQAVYDVPLPSLTLRANPDPGIVAVPSWFWVDGYGGQTLTHSKTVQASHTACRLNNGEQECREVDDSVTVTVELVPARYAWTFGDGTDGDFGDDRGLGRPFSDPGSPSPVAHAYRASSVAYVPQGGYPISLTVTFSAAFSVNGGAREALPDVRQTYTARHPVREVQPVVVR